MKQINVVVADSSPFVCRLLKSYLESVPDIRVIGVAHKGQALLELVEREHPQVITLGLEMPDMTGLEALKVAQAIRFTPAIVISGANMHAAAMTLEALNHGALDFVCKFTPGAAVDPNYLRQEVINKVRLASIASPPRQLAEAAERPEQAMKPGTDAKLKKLLHGLGATSLAAVDLGQGTVAAPALLPEKVIVIGASTGGPLALQQLLSHFPEDFSGGILVVQHLPAMFTAVLAEQLQRQLALQVKEAEEGDQLQRAAVLITPGGVNLQLNATGQIQFTSSSSPHETLPSINLTMQSVASVYGTKARGVLLTGMGQDGLEGLAAIRQNGGVTFAQTPDTCTMKGMPERAIEAGVVDHVAPPQRIARLLLTGA